jgi:hypothetical protein
MLTAKEVETINARMFEKVRDQQIRDQQIEIEELRKRAGPKPPDIRAIADGADVSPQQFAALNAAQGRGAFDKAPGLKRVTLRDPLTNRVTHHFYGNERAAWERFSNSPKKRGVINRDVE